MRTHGVLTCQWIAQVMKLSTFERILWIEYYCLHNSTRKEVKAGRLTGTCQSDHRAQKAESACEEPHPQPAVPQTTMQAVAGRE